MTIRRSRLACVGAVLLLPVVLWVVNDFRWHRQHPPHVSLVEWAWWPATPLLRGLFPEFAEGSVGSFVARPLVGTACLSVKVWLVLLLFLAWRALGRPNRCERIAAGLNAGGVFLRDRSTGTLQMLCLLMPFPCGLALWLFALTTRFHDEPGFPEFAVNLSAGALCVVIPTVRELRLVSSGRCNGLLLAMCIPVLFSFAFIRVRRLAQVGSLLIGSGQWVHHNSIWEALPDAFAEFRQVLLLFLGAIVFAEVRWALFVSWAARGSDSLPEGDFGPAPLESQP